VDQLSPPRVVPKPMLLHHEMRHLRCRADRIVHVILICKVVPVQAPPYRVQTMDGTFVCAFGEYDAEVSMKCCSAARSTDGSAESASLISIFVHVSWMASHEILFTVHPVKFAQCHRPGIPRRTLLHTAHAVSTTMLFASGSFPEFGSLGEALEAGGV